MMEGVNLTMIYCKNVCKCHNVPLVPQWYNKKRKIVIEIKNNWQISHHNNPRERFAAGEDICDEIIQNTTEKTAENYKHVLVEWNVWALSWQ
jgi:hypothetical protein